MVAQPAADGLSVAASKTAAAHCRAIAREETMKQLLSSRRIIKMWHRREKATIDRLVGTTRDAKAAAAPTHSAFTPSGLAVEDQVRKAWRSNPAGIPIF
jgi:hypothetical protein